jgi:hypothetical protein
MPIFLHAMNFLQHESSIFLILSEFVIAFISTYNDFDYLALRKTMAIVMDEFKV